jgi:AcrR family transcriptional regulator
MVATNPTPLPVAGEDDSSKRRQILDGARKVFLDLGFDGASMGEIARSAGVSKGTLYVYFADKSRLRARWRSTSIPDATSPPR